MTRWWKRQHGTIVHRDITPDARGMVTLTVEEVEGLLREAGYGAVEPVRDLLSPERCARVAELRAKLATEPCTLPDDITPTEMGAISIARSVDPDTPTGVLLAQIRNRHKEDA